MADPGQDASYLGMRVKGRNSDEDEPEQMEKRMEPEASGGRVIREALVPTRVSPIQLQPCSLVNHDPAPVLCVSPHSQHVVVLRLNQVML